MRKKNDSALRESFTKPYIPTKEHSRSTTARPTLLPPKARLYFSSGTDIAATTHPYRNEKVAHRIPTTRAGTACRRPPRPFAAAPSDPIGPRRPAPPRPAP